MNNDEKRNAIAGLLSTINFPPSREYPETMLPWADQVLALLAAPSAEGDDE